MNVRTVLLAALLLITPAGVATACPNCKASIPTGSSESNAALPNGFNWSIYMMLGSLAVVGGAVVRMLVREANRSDMTSQRRRAD